MTIQQKIKTFTTYSDSLDGDKKGEAQVFIDRLFQTFGHAGYKEAGAIKEYRVKRFDGQTVYADLLFAP